MAVRSGDGALDWRGARGDARPGGPALTTDTPYFVASIDKLVTATALFVLAERGALDLDGRLAAYLDPALVRGLHVSGASTAATSSRCGTSCRTPRGWPTTWRTGRRAVAA
jgi:CubicO group peptidase (beta-lactamase class C family)